MGPYIVYTEQSVYTHSFSTRPTCVRRAPRPRSFGGVVRAWQLSQESTAVARRRQKTRGELRLSCIKVLPDRAGHWLATPTWRDRGCHRKRWSDVVDHTKTLSHVTNNQTWGRGDCRDMRPSTRRAWTWRPWEHVFRRSTDSFLIDSYQSRFMMLPMIGLATARSWARFPPVAAVYQHQLSVPSLRGRLMSTSESWGVNGHTTWCTSMYGSIYLLGQDRKSQNVSLSEMSKLGYTRIKPTQL